MHNYGVCSSNEERCGLSYDSFGLRPLPELINVIQQRRLKGGDANELLPRLDVFIKFFQEGQVCSGCGGDLFKVTRPTASLAQGTEEYKRTTKMNEVIDAMHQLQALGRLAV
jgi:hypothetical protein